MMIETVIKGFIPNLVRINFYNCDNSIITYGKRGLSSGFSNTSHDGSFDRFRVLVVEKVHNTIII